MREFRHRNAYPNIAYPSTLIGQPIYPSSNGKIALAKTRFDLIPFAAVGEIADVLAYGADKYEANNWAREPTGADTSQHFAGISLPGGVAKTRIETGFSHLAHAGCCCFF